MVNYGSSAGGTERSSCKRFHPWPLRQHPSGGRSGVAVTPRWPEPQSEVKLLPRGNYHSARGGGRREGGGCWCSPQLMCSQTQWVDIESHSTFFPPSFLFFHFSTFYLFFVLFCLHCALDVCLTARSGCMKLIWCSHTTRFMSFFCLWIIRIVMRFCGKKFFWVELKTRQNNWLFIH